MVEHPTWYGFWDIIATRDFNGICDICKKKVNKENNVFIGKGKTIIIFHKRCFPTDEDKIENIMRTTPEDKLLEAFRNI